MIFKYRLPNGQWVSIPTIRGQKGVGIQDITKTNTEGLVDTYTILYTDGTTSTFDVTNGRGGTTEGMYTKEEVDALLAKLQPELVSGASIKTINGETLLGKGNLEIQGGAEVVQTTGQATDKVMSQDATTKAVNAVGDDAAQALNIINGQHGAVGIAPVVQETGDSTTAVMSQDAVTKALASAGGGKEWTEHYDVNILAQETGLYEFILPSVEEVFVLISRDANSSTGTTSVSVATDVQSSITVVNTPAINNAAATMKIYKLGDKIVGEFNANNKTNMRNLGNTIYRGYDPDSHVGAEKITKLIVNVRAGYSVDTNFKIFAR